MMREQYANFFAKFPDLHCQLINRIINGNTVIDHECVSGLSGNRIINGVVIYKIKNGKIGEAYFVKE